MRAYFCVLEVAVSANRCSVIQGCRICNKTEEDGNSSYPPTPLNASLITQPRRVGFCRNLVRGCNVGPSGISGATGSQLVRLTKTKMARVGVRFGVRVINPTSNFYQNVSEYAHYWWKPISGIIFMTLSGCGLLLLLQLRKRAI